MVLSRKKRGEGINNGNLGWAIVLECSTCIYLIRNLYIDVYSSFSGIRATVLDASYLFLRDGIVYCRYKVSIAGFSKVMDRRTTFEDFFDMKKNDLQSYLRDAGIKVSGNKRELAQMAFENLDANKSS
jgi:hypothetical protein